MMKKIKALAKSYGFHDIKELGTMNEYKVYDPIFTDGKERMIGYPHFILVKGNEMKMVIDDDFKISDFFYPIDPDEEDE